MSLGKRISELRKDKNLTQVDLADEMGITRSALSLYELDSREPDYALLIKLSDFFNCSTDYLLGRVVDRMSDAALTCANAVSLEGLSDEDIVAVKQIIEGLKAKHLVQKK